MQGQFGRRRKDQFQKRWPTVPCVKPGRAEEFCPLESQVQNGLRAHIKKVRRLKSLVAQVSACHARQENPSEACQELWTAILKASGFTKSFGFWIHEHCQMFVPLCCPHSEFLQIVLSAGLCWDECATHRRVSYLMTRNHGKAACCSIKEPDAPPLSSVLWGYLRACPTSKIAQTGFVHSTFADVTSPFSS